MSAGEENSGKVTSGRGWVRRRISCEQLEIRYPGVKEEAVGVAQLRMGLGNRT